MLTIALPKGRIAEETLDKFEKAFNEKFIFEDRKLILEKSGFRFLNVRNQDVPTYVKYLLVLEQVKSLTGQKVKSKLQQNMK